MTNQADKPSVEGLMATDYEEVLADHQRLVRRLDVALNGEAGAAKQASLCDIVSQVERLASQSAAAPPIAQPVAMMFKPNFAFPWGSDSESLQRHMSVPHGAPLYAAPPIVDLSEVLGELQRCANYLRAAATDESLGDATSRCLLHERATGANAAIADLRSRLDGEKKPANERTE